MIFTNHLNAAERKFSTIVLSMTFQKSPAFPGVSAVCGISCWNICRHLRNRDWLISLKGVTVNFPVFQLLAFIVGSGDA